jgi:hypothetical protein
MARAFFVLGYLAYTDNPTPRSDLVQIRSSLAGFAPPFSNTKDHPRCEQRPISGPGCQIVRLKSLLGER